MAWRKRRVHAELAGLHRAIHRHGTRVAASVALLSGAVAVRYHAFSANGADASGYLSEARMLSLATLSVAEPLAEAAGWPDAARTLAPLGWQPAAADPGHQVPTYALGLPLLMVLPHLAGGAVAASLLVAVSAATAVWCAARIASTLGGGFAAVLTATTLATIPVFLLESLQVMSDVPVTAAWLACWAALCPRVEKGGAPASAAASRRAGFAAAIAVLIRPNLAPLAALPALFVWLSAPGPRGRSAIRFAVPVAIAGAVIAYLQWRWFGSPLRSGYGTGTEIYSLANVVPNLRLYTTWLVETGGVWLLAAPAALFVRAGVLRWLLVFALLVCFAYFVYGTFEAWPYLRFLLPALALAAVMVSVGVARFVDALPSSARAPIAIALVLCLSGIQLARARELGVFATAARQSRALMAGHYLDAATPHHAVLISGEQSGAMRYYTTRSIVRWDLLDANALPQVEAALRRAGREVWIVLDDWEVALFRDKFGRTAEGQLDWPPVMDAGTLGRVQAWRWRDRARFLGGGRVVGDRVR